MTGKSFNHRVAAMFRECADLLRLQNANPYRRNAYVRAAETLEASDRDVRDILRQRGTDGLVELPGIGRGLASAIAEIDRSGRLSQLDRLRGAAEPEALFQAVPGIGPKLAERLHDELHVDSLEQLEMAAHDGRLAGVEGIGPRRAALIRSGLHSVLGRPPGARRRAADAPPVDLLLDVDSEYRRKASAGRLPRIAPKRFNPKNEAWLPVLHTQRGHWQFTALYSNTARAHELGRTGDWVVLYFHDGEHDEGQCTVVTETHGPLEGRRVVRGRESECRRLLRA